MNLINFSEGVYLATHGLILIVKNKTDKLNVKNIAKTLSVSEAHLSKIFQKLRKAGIIESMRGPKGGFKLTKKPEEITFLKIYEIIEGKIETNICPFGKKACPFKSCVMQKDFTNISFSIYDTLKNTTLNNFL